MWSLVSPLCLLLALVMLIAGFALWATEPPQPPVELHRARAEGAESLGDVLEADLARRRRERMVLLGGLFGGSVLLTMLGLGTVGWRPSNA